MEIYLKTNNVKLLLLMILTTLISCTNSTQKYQVIFERGVDEFGNPTEVWIDVIRDQFSKEELEQVIHTKKELSDSEIGWANLIKSKLNFWEEKLEDIAIPFSDIQIPDKISVVAGNTGKVDAFASSRIETKLFLNLSILVREYGNAENKENKDRIDRLFSHEFTHLLQYQWLKNNPYSADTHLKKALLICFMEGIAHYRSISNSWRTSDGTITEHAESALTSLEQEFVKRLSALKNASDVEAAELMANITTGRFDKKWGALTVALWFVKESNGDDKKLREWINLGPEGIIKLAQKHLPEKLKVEFEKGLEI